MCFFPKGIKKFTVGKNNNNLLTTFFPKGIKKLATRKNNKQSVIQTVNEKQTSFPERA